MTTGRKSIKLKILIREDMNYSEYHFFLLVTLTNDTNKPKLQISQYPFKVNRVSYFCSEAKWRTGYL